MHTRYSVDVELMFLLRPQRAYLIRYCPRVNTYRLPPTLPSPSLSPFLYTLHCIPPTRKMKRSQAEMERSVYIPLCFCLISFAVIAYSH